MGISPNCIFHPRSFSFVYFESDIKIIILNPMVEAYMKQIKIISIKVGVLLFMLMWSLYSHPHMFVDVTQHLVMNENGLEGIRMEWLVDEMNSLQIVEAYDINKNSEIDPSENSEMTNSLFPLIERVVSISINENSDFDVNVAEFNSHFTDQNLLQCSFFLSLAAVNYSNDETDIAIKVDDDQQFVAFETNESASSIDDMDGFTSTTKAYTENVKSFCHFIINRSL